MCESCQRHHFFLRCRRCDGANIVDSARQTAPAAWNCRWCLAQNMNSGLGRFLRRDATADEAWQALERHGLINADAQTRVLGGFELVGGRGDCPPIGTLCSIVAGAEGIGVVAEVGATGSMILPYRDVLNVETSGRGVLVEQELIINGHTTYGRMSAKATTRPSRNPRKRSVESFIRITARESELRMRNWTVPPDEVRDILGRIFTTQMPVATPPPPVVIEAPTSAPTPEPAAVGPLDELERLTKLHAAGALTDTEFELARAKQIKRLHTERS